MTSTSQAKALADELADRIDQCAAIQLVGSDGIKGYLPVGSPKIISAALRSPLDARREEIARIIAPSTWAIYDKNILLISAQRRDFLNNDDAIEREKRAVAASLAKADAILAISGEQPRSDGDLWACTGCGTRKSLEQILGESPTALSCCPERKMAPDSSTNRSGEK